VKLTNEHLKTATEKMRQALRDALESLDNPPTIESIKNNTCDCFDPMELIDDLVTFSSGIAIAGVQELPEG
jgi:hypothetical protein